MLDSGAEGPRFKSQSQCRQVTALAHCSHPLCLCSPSSKIGSSPLKGCKGNCRSGDVMAAYRQVYDSYHLQADCQEPGSAPEPYALQSSSFNFFTELPCFLQVNDCQYRLLKTRICSFKTKTFKIVSKLRPKSQELQAWLSFPRTEFSCLDNGVTALNGTQCWL